MLTLCMDTAYKYLSCALIEDDTIIAAFDGECFKRQSEEIFMTLDRILKESDRKVLDIDSICISKGPGSYTGVRIAMTIAKVIATVKKIDLYTISTLCLYAGRNEKTMVIMDARANRAYVGIYDGDVVLQEDMVMELDAIQTEGYSVIGDGSLVGKEDYMPVISNCFLKTKNLWKKEEDVAHLVPAYLKESDAYFK